MSQQILTIVAAAVLAAIYQYTQGKLSASALKENILSVLLPFIWLVCAFGAYLVVRAAIDLHTEVVAEAQKYKPTLPEYQPKPPTPWRAIAAASICILLLGLISYLSFDFTLKRSFDHSGAEVAKSPKKNNETPPSHAPEEPRSKVTERKSPQPQASSRREPEGLPKTHKPKPQPRKDDSQPSSPSRSDIELSVSLIQPSAPAIVVENQSNSVAEGVSWELVMFRTRDHAFLSYSSQTVGYIKAHSKTAPYSMDLNSLPHAPIPQSSQLINGDSVIGTLVVDCPYGKPALN